MIANDLKTKIFDFSSWLQLGGERWYWIAVFSVCLLLEVAALFYQHVLDIYPCELCIYVRVWFAVIGLLSLLAPLFIKWLWIRTAMCFAGLILSFGLALETWNLIVVEYGLGDGGSCSFFANFPKWAPLDKWLPMMFEVQEFCQATPVLVFGITMTHALIVISTVFISAFLISFIGSVLVFLSK